MRFQKSHSPFQNSLLMVSLEHGPTSTGFWYTAACPEDNEPDRRPDIALFGYMILPDCGFHGSVKIKGWQGQSLPMAREG